MNGDQLSEFEEQARQVGRKSIPREWRAEILDAALGDGEEPGAAPDDAGDAGRWEGRIRKAERRAMWSMAACLVATLFLIALLFRARWEPRAAQSFMEKDSMRKRAVSDLDSREDNVTGRGGESSGRIKHLAADPPPTPPPPPSKGPTGVANPIEESEGGFLIRDASVNDTFQKLAKKAGKQYFRNTEVESLEFKVSGHLDGGDPMKQMEELASKRNLTLYQKGNTVYLLNDEQLNPLPGSEVAKTEPKFGVDSHSESFRPLALGSSEPLPPKDVSTPTSLGQHSDGSSWGDVSIAGGVFTGTTATEGTIELERLASRKGINLSRQSGVGGVGYDSFTAAIPSREEYEAENADVLPLSSGNALAPDSRPGDKPPEQATISLIDGLSIPAITTTKREVDKKALEGLEKNAAEEPWSTFSLNVSDVSFKLAKAALSRGEWPAANQVRVEEFVNAFDYGDPAPSQQEKVACKLEQAAHPFMQQRNLLRVSMRTAALGRSADTPLRLTVLLDNSGSMDRADRVESVQNAFQLLANQLNPADRVTLIGFARTARLLADRLPGDRVAELAEVVASTPSEGGTNIEQALELGIEKAKEQMVEGAQNRIILLTDGAVNLGNAEPEDLAKLVESMRQQEIAFDACGVGADGLNDEVLEALTRKGDGRYYFLDRPEDADAGFAKQIAGALRPAAKNVKVQVKFNPHRVGRYKLYGFEKHRLKKEDFRDDSVDAAELAAREAGNAIYQVEILPEGTGEIGTVSVRFQDTESGRMIEREWTIPYDRRAPRLEDSAASLRLASGAALLGEKLKGSPIGEFVEMAPLGKLIHGLTSEFPSDRRVADLVQMTNKVRELLGE